jgi:hypothetical protein
MTNQQPEGGLSEGMRRVIAAGEAMEVGDEPSASEFTRDEPRFRVGDVLVDPLNQRYHVIPDGASVAPPADGSSLLYVSRANRPGSPLTLLERPKTSQPEFGPGDVVRDPGHLVPDGNGNFVPFQGIVGLTPRDAWGNLIVGGSSVHPEPKYELVLKAHHAVPGIPMIALTPELRAILKDLEFCARTEHVPYLDSTQLRVLQSTMTTGEEPARPSPESPETSLSVRKRLFRDGYDVKHFDGHAWTGSILAVSFKDVFIDIGRKQVIELEIPEWASRDHIPSVGTIVRVDEVGSITPRDPAVTLESDRGA